MRELILVDIEYHCWEAEESEGDSWVIDHLSAAILLWSLLDS